MRTLKDVYIKVNKSNHEELQKLLQYPFSINVVIAFEFDNKYSWYITDDTYCEKVSLSELKRLIDTIPTREEITRLKRQISAYKMNLSLANERCKELQSDNDILVDCMEKLDDKLELTEKKLDIQADLIRDKNAQIKQLKQRKWWQIWK